MRGLAIPTILVALAAWQAGGCTSGKLTAPPADSPRVAGDEGAAPGSDRQLGSERGAGSDRAAASDAPGADAPPTPTATFRFVSWADTKSATSVLTALSNQVAALKPVLTIYSGDMVSTWSDSAMNTWKNAVNGGKANGIFDITFTVRGNHDASGSSTGYRTWMIANHPLDKAAAAIGAKNYKEHMVYSFDYANSHFAGLDSTGDADTIGSDQIAWLDTDLAAAEQRGLTHAFIYFHGPIYCMNGHCSCTTNICESGIYDIVDVLNKHPIVTATFHGHEHIYTYTYLDSKRDPKITRPFHQFITGDAGAGPSTARSGRYDYWMNAHGFLVLDVDGPKITASFYKQGGTQPEKTISISK